MAKIVFTPSGFESPSFDATLGRAFLFEQIERHVPQHHKVVLAVILAHATGVLLKGDVEHPMETIFDPQWLRTAPPKAWALALSIYKGGLNKLPEAMQASILQANIEVKRYNSLVDFDKFDKLRANRFVLNEQAEKVKTSCLAVLRILNQEQAET